MNSSIELDLYGPQFTQSATEITQKLSVGSILIIRVYGVTPGSIPSLKDALHKLRNFFQPGGHVKIPTSQALPKGTASELRAAAGVPVIVSTPILQGWGAIGAGNAAAMSQQMQAADAQQAQAIGTQMANDGQKAHMERWKIKKDTKTKMFEIFNDTAETKGNRAERAVNNWSPLMSS